MTGTVLEATPAEIPLLGVVILAGVALAGFLIAWRGQRRKPVALDGGAGGGQPASGRPVTN